MLLPALMQSSAERALGHEPASTETLSAAGLNPSAVRRGTERLGYTVRETCWGRRRDVSAKAAKETVWLRARGPRRFSSHKRLMKRGQNDQELQQVPACRPPAAAETFCRPRPRRSRCTDANLLRGAAGPPARLLPAASSERQPRAAPAPPRPAPLGRPPPPPTPGRGGPCPRVAGRLGGRAGWRRRPERSRARPGAALRRLASWPSAAVGVGHSAGEWRAAGGGAAAAAAGRARRRGGRGARPRRGRAGGGGARGARSRAAAAAVVAAVAAAEVEGAEPSRAGGRFSRGGRRQHAGGEAPELR